MREILFRGKKIKDNDWAYGTVAYYSDEENSPFYIVRIGTDDGENYFPFYEVKAETIGQFTGLTDYHGKKIFEGDILEGIVRKLSNKIRNLVVITDIRECKFLALYCNEYEVIGNIHDNHELLEGNNG